MSDDSAQPGVSELTMSTTQDDRGYSRRSLGLRPDGTLVIEGQDLGRGVEEFWGKSECEFARSVEPDSVNLLRAAAGIGDGPLLEAIRSSSADNRTSRTARPQPLGRNVTRPGQ